MLVLLTCVLAVCGCPACDRSVIFAKELIILRHDDARCREHTRAVLEHTIAREWNFVRGSREAGDETTEKDKETVSQLRRLERGCEVLGGDIRLDVVQHVETGCCGWDRATAVDNVTAAILDGGLILGLNSATPAKNWWGTVAQHLGHQVAARNALTPRRDGERATVSPAEVIAKVKYPFYKVQCLVPFPSQCAKSRTADMRGMSSMPSGRSSARSGPAKPDIARAASKWAATNA